MLETAGAILRTSGYHGVVHFDMRSTSGRSARS
jgi:hypothetical protein